MKKRSVTDMAVSGCAGLAGLLLVACGAPVDQVADENLPDELLGKSSQQQDLAVETEEEEIEIKGC